MQRPHLVLLLLQLLLPAASAALFCGEDITHLLPERTALFFEHDEGGSNRLQRLSLHNKTVDTVLKGGDMVFGGPAADYLNARIYLMVRSPDGQHVQIKRYHYLTGETETVFSEPAENVPALVQAPAQIPAAYHDDRFFFFLKHTSARGRIYALDLAGVVPAAPKGLSDAKVIYEDGDTCLHDNEASCLVVGSLPNTQLRADCDGTLWFNEGGRSLSKYAVPANLNEGDRATRTVVVDKAWLEDPSRCKKSDRSCRIEGFAIDTAQAHSASTPVWFTYNAAYSSASAYDSIWSFEAGSFPGSAQQVYLQVLYEIPSQGQYLGSIELDPTSNPPTLLVNTYKQNSGARSIVRLPQTYPSKQNDAPNRDNENSWFTKQPTANLNGFNKYAPFRAVGEVVVGSQGAMCTGSFYNTQLPCGYTEMSLTHNCGADCSVNQWRYPAMGAPQLIVIPGKTPSVLGHQCAEGSAVMDAASSFQHSCAASSPPGNNAVAAGAGRFVAYVQDKPFGALSGVGFGLNLVIDDGRLPTRRTVNGNSQWTTWAKDVPMKNIQSATSIIGPVVDRSRRALLYLRPKNCDGSGGTCPLWQLISYSLATATETVLYENSPWEFPTTSPIFTGTFTGRSVMAYDEGARIVYLTSVPRNSVKELVFYSIHLGDDLTTPLDAEKAHCSVRLRHTFDRGHGFYNSLAASCDGTVHLAINSRLWRFTSNTDEMEEISATQAFRSGMEATGASHNAAIRAVATTKVTSPAGSDKTLFFATIGNVYRAKPDGSGIEQLFSLANMQGPLDTPLANIASIAVDPFDETVFVVGDATKYTNTKGGDRAIVRMHQKSGGDGFFLVGGSHGDGVWRPTKYPAAGATGIVPIYLSDDEVSLFFLVLFSP